MMNAATRRHLVRTGLAVACLRVDHRSGWLYDRNSSSAALVQQLQTARVTQLDSILDEISQRGTFAVLPLTDALAAASRKVWQNWRLGWR